MDVLKDFSKLRDVHLPGPVFAGELKPDQSLSQIIYVVDDDAGVRKSTSLLFRALGFEHRPYISGTDFLTDVADLRCGCVLLDLRMQQLSGLDVLAELKRAGLETRFPVIVITGHGDIETAVKAMKLGAIDFLEKPFSEEALLVAIAHGNEIICASGPVESRLDFTAIAAKLPVRQMEVLRGLTHGLPNKAIARLLCIAPRTVEMHRANLMASLGTRSLAELLRLTVPLGLQPLERDDHT